MVDEVVVVPASKYNTPRVVLVDASGTPVTPGSGGVAPADGVTADQLAAGLAGKVSTSTFTSALAGKADVSALADKADASALAGKVDTAALDAALALKADASALSSGLATKVNTSTYTAGLALKADASALAGKADVSALTSGLAGKVDTATYTSGLAGKADASRATALETLTTSGRLSGGTMDARYSAVNLTGTYASRPAASTVLTGTLYFATNTLETYRATGTAGVLASSWTVVPTGGNELAYAESFTSYTVPAGTANALADVPGMSITVVVPERPFYLEAAALLRNTNTTFDTAVAIVDITGTATTVAEIHEGRSINSDDFRPGLRRKRISGQTPGTTRTYKLSALQRTAAWDIVAASQYPTYLAAYSA